MPGNATRAAVHPESSPMNSLEGQKTQFQHRNTHVEKWKILPGMKKKKEVFLPKAEQGKIHRPSKLFDLRDLHKVLREISMRCF